MEDSVCINCQKTKASFQCGLCGQSVCKKCVQFVEEDSFLLMGEVPAELTHGRYCGPCFDEKIAPELSNYERLVERAKQVHVFHVEDMAETRLFNRQSKPLSVENSADKYQAIMTLAYQAVKDGFNTLVDVQVNSEKVDLSGYRTSKWSARGIPVKLDAFIPNRKRRYIGKPPEPTR